MNTQARLRYTLITDMDAARDLAPQWYALLERAVHPQATQSPAWMLTWWDTFGYSDGRSMRLVTFHDGSELVGIVPLLRRRLIEDRVAPVRRIELIGSGEPEEDEIASHYIGAIVARGFEEPVARQLAEMLRREQLGGWDELRMTAMSGDDPWVPLFADALKSEGMNTSVEQTGECPYISLPNSWDAYLAALDGPNRYFVRRTVREFEAWANPLGWKLHEVTEEGDLERGWRVLRDMHEERWNNEGAFSRPRFSQFHRRMIQELYAGKCGKLELRWLEVGGNIVAAVYNIISNGHVQCYQSGRKLDVPKHARPGIAIHLLAIQKAIAAGHRTYDFLARPDQYKRQLAPFNRRKRVALSAVGPGLQAWLLNHARKEARVLFRYAKERLAAARSEQGAGASPGSERGAASQRAGQGATQGAGPGAAQGAGSGATQGAGPGATQGAGQGAVRQGAEPGATQGARQGAAHGG